MERFSYTHSAIDGVGGQLHAATVLSLGTHCIGEWYGFRGLLFGYEEEKILPTTRVEPRNVEPVVSRYTDRAILALDITKLLEY